MQTKQCVNFSRDRRLNITAGISAILADKKLWNRWQSVLMTQPAGRFIFPVWLSRFDTFYKPFKIGVYFPSQRRCLSGAYFMPKWRNWQTRMVQVHVLARVWGFESLLRHQLIKVS